METHVCCHLPSSTQRGETGQDHVHHGTGTYSATSTESGQDVRSATQRDVYRHVTSGLFYVILHSLIYNAIIWISTILLDAPVPLSIGLN